MKENEKTALENRLTLQAAEKGNGLWNQLTIYAETCSWSAGKSLAQQMRTDAFEEWERVFAVLDGERIAGFCTFARRDCIPEAPYSPYIGYLFVDETYRGHRLSQWMLEKVLRYAGETGFEKVYLVSDHVNFYEKYGFVKIDEYPAPWDPEKAEGIFVRETTVKE